MDPYVPPSSNEGTLQLFTDEDNFSSLPTVSSQDAQPRTSESKRSRANYQEDQPAVPTPQFMDVPVNAPTQTPPSVHLRAMSGEAAFKVPSIEDPIGPFLMNVVVLVRLLNKVIILFLMKLLSLFMKKSL